MSRYQVTAVNPRTNEERPVTVEFSAEDEEFGDLSFDATGDSKFNQHLCNIIHLQVPFGFLMVGNSLRHLQ